MKKRILFVIQQMSCGGVEKALLNYINLMDKEHFECDILSILNEGEFLSFIPKDIKVLEYQCPRYIKMMTKSLEKPDFSEEKNHIKKLCWIFLYYLNKTTIKFFEKNIIFSIIFKRFKRVNSYSNYDAIIDFHGYGAYTTYLAAHEKGKMKRISWIHEQNIYRAYRCISSSYNKFDTVFGCSNECCEHFIETFPKLEDRVKTCYNYLDIEEIKQKADLFIPKEFQDETRFKIVSVGRVGEQKSFGRVIEAAAELKKHGFDTCWIVVGDGDQIEMLRRRVADAQLEENVKFVGYCDNPYPYIKNADLYVQTSIAEGFCTTISEAVVLGKAVVTTDVSGVREQLDNGKGGVIVEQSVEEIASGISMLLKERNILKDMSEHCEKKNMDFVHEIGKLCKSILD